MAGGQVMTALQQSACRPKFQAFLRQPIRPIAKPSQPNGQVGQTDTDHWHRGEALFTPRRFVDPE